MFLQDISLGLQNLALNRPSRQSYDCNCVAFPKPSLAVDGKKNPLGILTACSGVPANNEPWWSVHLQYYSQVRKVIITKIGLYSKLQFQ